MASRTGYKARDYLGRQKGCRKASIKRGGFRKRLVVTMNENRDITLFLVVRQVILQKLSDVATSSF